MMKKKSYTRKFFQILSKSVIIFSVFISIYPSAYAQNGEQPCSKWGPDSLRTVEMLSIYKEDFDQGSYETALKPWRYVFKNAPGAREYTYVDGVKLYQYLIDKTEDEALKDKLADTLLMIYDQRMRCFGEKGDVYGRKGIDMRRYKKDMVKETYETFKKAIELDGNNTAYYILYPYMAASVLAQRKGHITDEEVIDNYARVLDIIAHNVNSNSKYKDRYEEIQNKIEPLVIDYLSCEKLIPIAKKRFEAQPYDINNLNVIYNQMKIAKCYDDPLFLEVAKALNQLEPNAARTYYIGKTLEAEKKYTEALEMYKKAVELAEKNEDKAEYYMSIASIYRRLDDFPTARMYAEKAIELRPNWGEPYLFIGILYASSGSKCGPGTGWDSQVVTWPAIDMFAKAKSVDPSIADRANELIAKYSQYMPSREDGFMRSINEGDTYMVECWINRQTTVRFAK